LANRFWYDALKLQSEKLGVDIPTLGHARPRRKIDSAGSFCHVQGANCEAKTVILDRPVFAFPPAGKWLGVETVIRAGPVVKFQPRKSFEFQIKSENFRDRRYVYGAPRL